MLCIDIMIVRRGGDGSSIILEKCVGFCNIVHYYYYTSFHLLTVRLDIVYALDIFSAIFSKF